MGWGSTHSPSDTASSSGLAYSDITAGKLGFQSLPGAVNPAAQAGLDLRNGRVDRQAAMMAYLDDFRLMRVLTAMPMPLLLLIRAAKRVPRQPGEAEGEMALEV